MEPSWVTPSLRLWSPDQLETISACSDAFLGELVLRFKAEHGMFHCGLLMFYCRAIKIVRIGYFQHLTGASWCRSNEGPLLVSRVT